MIFGFHVGETGGGSTVVVGAGGGVGGNSVGGFG